MERTPLLLLVTLLSAACHAKPAVDDIQVFALRDQVDQSGAQAFRVVDNSGAAPVRNDVVVNPAGGTIDVKIKNGEDKGSEVVIDYAKGVTGIYERSTRRCLLVAGVSKDAASAQNAQGTDTYPVQDRALLPAALRDKCAGRPLNWVEATNEDEVKARAPAVGERVQEGDGILQRPARFWPLLVGAAFKVANHFVNRRN